MKNQNKSMTGNILEWQGANKNITKEDYKPKNCSNCKKFVEYEEESKGIYELYNYHIETSDDGLCLNFTQNTPMGYRYGHRKTDICENWEEK